jgi:hypothetical protein
MDPKSVIELQFLNIYINLYNRFSRARVLIGQYLYLRLVVSITSFMFYSSSRDFSAREQDIAKCDLFVKYFLLISNDIFIPLYI